MRAQNVAAVLAVALVSGLLWAAVYPDLIDEGAIGRAEIRGQGSPVEHLTLNEGTDRDVCISFDLGTDQSICYESTAPSGGTVGFRQSAPDLWNDTGSNVLMREVNTSFVAHAERWLAATDTYQSYTFGPVDIAGGGAPQITLRSALPATAFNVQIGRSGDARGDMTLWGKFNAKGDGSTAGTYEAAIRLQANTAGGTYATAADGIDTTNYNGFWRNDGTYACMGWGTAGTEEFALCQSAADTLKLDNASVGLNIESPGVLQGDRFSVPCDPTGTAGTDTYCFMGGTAMTAALGYNLVRAGSLLGVSCSCVLSLYVSTTNVDCVVEINGAEVLTSSSGNLTSAGRKEWRTTQARATDAFTAGSFWGVEFDVTSAGATVSSCSATLDMIYDD